MNFHERFKFLAIFHYVLAGLLAIGGCFPLIHVTLGILMLRGAFTGPNQPPPEMGLMFVGVGAMMSILFWTLAGLACAAGYFLHVQRYYTFCLVIAAIETLMMPIGTVLGVFTIVTLVDAQGKAMFERPDVHTDEEISV